MNFQENPFEEDDYAQLNLEYFKPLRESKLMAADPSGWIDTYSNVGNIYSKFSGSVQGYHTDISNQLFEKKKPLLELFSEWDAYSNSSENITLCHSATVGSVVVLAFLIAKGVRNIISETPNYFATYYQAETMGLNMIRIPTYYDSDFQLNIDLDIIKRNSPCAIWLTQPRTALGFNQDPEYIKKILAAITAKDFIVIDEATEQFFPSVLSTIDPQNYPQIIKIRSVFKGLGINGIRLCYIAHHDSFRSDIADEMEVFLGALDIYSIDHAVELARNVKQFKEMLSIANEQVLMLRSKAEKVLKGSNCELSEIVNGYIGSAYIHFNPSNLSKGEQRKKFVEYCANKNVPVILGSAMGFPAHENMEFIRLNYFNRDYNIINGLKIISQFVS